MARVGRVTIPSHRSAVLHPKEQEVPQQFQLHHLDEGGQALAKELWSDLGNVATRAADTAEKYRTSIANPNTPEKTRKKHAQDLANLESAQRIGLVDQPLTVESAAQNRVRAIRSNAARTAAAGGDIRYKHGLVAHDTPAGEPAGPAWYLEHADTIARSAEGHDFDPERAIVAAGAMSPQNSPESEKRAAHAIIRAHSQNPKVTAATSQGAKILGVPEVGHSVDFGDLSPDQIRGLASGPKSKHVTSSADFATMGQGSTELQTGIDVIRGNKDLKDVAVGTGKVGSYIQASLDAHRSTPLERSELFRRVHEVFSDKPYFEQDTLFGPEWEKDPWGHAHSTHGILDPNATTAEDTWMQSLSANQPNAHKVLDTGKGSARLGKFVGSNADLQAMPVSKKTTVINKRNKTVSSRESVMHPAGDKALTADELRHGMNNAATIKAGSILSDEARARGRNLPVNIPSVAVQAAAWVGERQDAGKDDLYNEAMKLEAKANGPAEPAEGQYRLFDFNDAGEMVEPKKPKINSVLGPVVRKERKEAAAKAAAEEAAKAAAEGATPHAAPAGSRTQKRPKK